MFLHQKGYGFEQSVCTSDCYDGLHIDLGGEGEDFIATEKGTRAGEEVLRARLNHQRLGKHGPDRHWHLFLLLEAAWRGQ